MSKHLVPWKRSVKGYKTGCQKVKHRFGPIKAGLTCLLSRWRHSSWGYPLDPAEAGPRHLPVPHQEGDIYIYDFMCVCAHLLSCVWLFGTPWTSRLLCPWGFPGKNTGVGSHFLLQRILPTQEWNPGLLCLLSRQVNALPLVPPAYTLISRNNL